MLAAKSSILHLFLIATVVSRLILVYSLVLTSVKVAQNSSFYDPVDQPIFQLSSDSTVAFYLEEALSLANTGGSNTGEVLRIATQINSTDEESIYSAFYPVAEAINTLAESIDPDVDPVGARENYFHASSYYRGAAFFLIQNQSDSRLVSLWDQQITAFDKAIALLKPAPGENFTVKADNSSIGPYEVPGYFYKANSSNSTKLPTVMIVTGYDGSQQELYHSACTQILSRGINCVTYEGPGQPSPRRYQNIGFISDWNTAASPVVSYILNRTDVDPTKLIHMGVSYGGILAPLAVAQEPRVTGMILLDGLANLQTDLLTQFGPLADIYESGNATEFDEYMLGFINNASTPIQSKWIVQQGLYAFNTKSPYDWLTRLGEANVTDTVAAAMGQRPVYVAKGQVSTHPPLKYRFDFDTS